jgi:iron complex outermembrane receptor protein
VTPGCSTGVANIGGTYRAVETCGNANLEPETAKSFNVGLLFSPGNFNASVDYFIFNFKEELTAESASRMYTTMFPTAAGHCNEAQYAALQARFTFSGACGNGNVIKIKTYNVNGPATDTSGIDVRLEYLIPRLLGGSLTAGLEATYLIEYDRGSFKLNDDATLEIAPPEDRAGKHDLVSQFFSYPKIKGNIFFSYSVNDFTVRLQTRYSEGTESAFGTPVAPKVDDFWQHDLIVRAALPWNTTLTASVQNILNSDPPDAPSQFNYDYTSGNPLGRVFELGVKTKF